MSAAKFSGEYHWIFAADSRGHLPRKKTLHCSSPMTPTMARVMA
jgi:hypothetical protein